MKFLKSLVPKWVKTLIFKSIKPWSYIKAYLRDARRFSRNSSVFSHGGRRENLRSLIAIDYHRIEKGLALPNPREAFGLAVVENLLGLLDQYVTAYGVDWTVEDAMASLANYLERFSSVDSLAESRRKLTELTSKVPSMQQLPKRDAIGTFELEEHRKTLSFDFAGFYRSRHSVREFSGEPISESVIADSVRLAMRAPSVCNRQPWKVWCVSEKQRIDSLCRIQGGSRGFSSDIDKLLVVGVDLSEFYLIGERNECWVDGGIFLQSLLICLHANGVGACPLNWCVSDQVDQEARKIVPIEDSTVIIALTAVGHLKEVTKFARSERRPIEDVLKFI